MFHWIKCVCGSTMRVVVCAVVGWVLKAEIPHTVVVRWCAHRSNKRKLIHMTFFSTHKKWIVIYGCTMCVCVCVCVILLFQMHFNRFGAICMVLSTINCVGFRSFFFSFTIYTRIKPMQAFFFAAYFIDFYRFEKKNPNKNRHKYFHIISVT